MSDTMTVVVTSEDAITEFCEPTAALRFESGKLMQGWRISRLDGGGRLQAIRIEYRPVEGQDP